MITAYSATRAVFVTESLLLNSQRKNLALLKPTWQSSTYVDSVRYHQSSLAVDGNIYTDIYHGSCAITYVDAKPWWAVDIGFLTYVYSVTLTNRGEGQYGKILFETY